MADELRPCPAGCGHMMRPCPHGCVCHKCDGKGATKSDACPKCGVGTVLESVPGFWCSRRYAIAEPCDWESGDVALPASLRPEPGGGK